MAKRTVDRETLAAYKDGVLLDQFEDVFAVRSYMAELYEAVKYRVGKKAKRLGYTTEEQLAFVLNVISLEGGRVQRSRLAQRVCRKYRGIDGPMLDFLVSELAARGLVRTFEETSPGLLGRKRRVYEVASLSLDAMDEAGFVEVEGERLPVVRRK